MIEETERLIQHDLSSNIEEVEENDKFKTACIEETVMQGKRTSLFFIQLLICSLLIWSLLFVKDSPYGKQMIGSVNGILSQSINVAPVEQVVNDLTVAIKQIL